MNLVTEGRKLVSIRKINAIEPIDGADMIVVATVDGWKVVVKKEEFKVGDYCVFFEIDSFLPASDARYDFLTSKGTKTDEAGVERFRLRTIKLRKQISQGLVLPIAAFWDDFVNIVFTKVNDDPSDIEGDVAILMEELEENRWGIEEFLNVTKYESPAERNSNGGGASAKTAGTFPFIFPKTDEDRLQNVWGKYTNSMKGVAFRRSLKLEGSSETIAFISNPDFFITKLDDNVLQYNEETQEMDIIEVKPYPFQWEDGQAIVCSRNNTLKFAPDNHFWKAALKDDIPTRLKDYCVANNRQLAIQGECMGPGVQGNIEGFTENEFFAFRVYDIEANGFLDDAEFHEFTAALGLSVAPQAEIVCFFDVHSTIDDALKSAEHKSINAAQAEGDVYKSVGKVNGETIHFKVINNQYLLKQKD